MAAADGLIVISITYFSQTNSWLTAISISSEVKDSQI
jgi:hypothetical protein